ncbi:MAG: hypothetical protein J1E39_00415 [Eubacterium sp.]|nr:hypothetical protein [Eubacterium sp.]
MLKYTDISAPLDYDEKWLINYIAEKLKIKATEIKDLTLLKKSVDARKKSDIRFVLTVGFEIADSKSAKAVIRQNKKLSYYTPQKYMSPKAGMLTQRPVVVGFGPAGMFAALYLAQCGVKPIVLERGDDADTRLEKVRLFHTKGILDEECNVQFGEGGAGTFSDGKLNTGVNSPLSFTVFSELVRHGAPSEIMYNAKPHIGTDKLCETVKNIRKEIISLGGEVIFGARFCNFTLKDGKICSAAFIKDNTEHIIDTDRIILACGHSARDVFYLMRNNGVALEAKNFSVGMRIEHTQEELNRSMYGDFYNHPKLGAADYKLAVHLPDGRGVYSFCMCPGGTVVASSSEKETIVTNGMSNFARDGKNANSALLVSVTPADFDGAEITAGIDFQRKIEHAAYIAAGANYSAPATLVGDFLDRKQSTSFGSIKPTYAPNTAFVRPEEYLPEFACDALRYAIPCFGKKISCFNNRDAVLTGPETRSSSPIRIVRGDNLQSISAAGLYPCGEGAGYAGGIVTAAIDGIKCAMAVMGR